MARPIYFRRLHELRAAKAARRPAARKERLGEARVLDCLRAAGRPLSEAEIIRATGVGHGPLHVALLVLSNTGMIEVLDRGRYAAKEVTV